MVPPDSPRGAEHERFALVRSVVFQAALLLGGLAAFLFLLWELRDFLSPLMVAAAAAVLMWPMREHRAVRSLLLAGGLLLLLWLLSVMGEVLLPFLVVYLLAYLLDPAVTAAQRRWRVPRWASSLVLTLVAVGAIVLILVLLVPNVVGRVEELATGILASLGGLQDWIMQSRLIAYLDEAGFVERAELQTRLSAVLRQQVGGLVAALPAALQTVFNSVGAIIALITTLTLIPVLLFYTLRDFPTISDSLIRLFPTVGGKRAYLQHTTHIVGSYLRGQLTISAISAFNVTLFLSLFGVPFSLLIGLISGVLNMIPNIGIIITNVIGVVIAFIFGTPIDVVIVLAVLFGQQILESTVLSPNIMSYQVGLHPVLVILSLLLFGSTMGFLGLLIAVPLTAILVTFYQTFRDAMTLELADYHAPERSLVIPPSARPSPAERLEDGE